MKEVLEVVVKDPKRLAAIVAEHNGRVGAANEGQLSTARVLRARKKALEEERDRLVTAIAQARGASKALVEGVERRERELEEVAAKIAEAESRVLPVLVPSIARVKDFVSGEAALFTGDFDADRKLLTETVSCILVNPDGSVVVELRDSSLFTPVRQVQLGRRALAPEGLAKGTARNELRTHFGRIKSLVEQEDPAAAANEPYELLVPGGEFPPSFMPLGDEPRPSEISAATRAASKVALASPAGRSRDIEGESETCPIAIVLCNVRDLEAA